ncbi:zinc finger BED domain-containing protein RICESLEEPER 2 [Tanacetum coccineum]|uniref:Zinc finger BED domain-containing protein RICESLEEPER 2 n=1 Tax=Tanacetum coccineum TaxID=301880 RepID=A0ABQ4YXP9_9ASTR
MAWDVLSIQATSVASESAFSRSGRVPSIRRTRLTPASLEVCMCLKDHLDATEQIQHTSILENCLDFEAEILEEEVLEHEAIALSDEEVALDEAASEAICPDVRACGNESDGAGMRCGDLNHLIGECLKHPWNKEQKAFVRGSWDDRENEDEDKTIVETCLMAQSSNEVWLRIGLKPDEWIKDSGCSKHIRGNKSLFSTYKAYDGGKDNAKIARKLSKPDKHEHGNGIECANAGRMLSKSLTSQEAPIGQNPLERISKKRTKNEAKTTKPDTEWKSVEKTKSRQSLSVKKSTKVNPDKSKVQQKGRPELGAPPPPHTFDELGVGDYVHEFGDSHALQGSLDMPTLSLESLYEIFCRFPLSLLNVVNFYRTFDNHFLCKKELLGNVFLISSKRSTDSEVGLEPYPSGLVKCGVENCAL